MLSRRMGTCLCWAGSTGVHRVDQGPAAWNAGGDVSDAESRDGGLQGSSCFLPSILQSWEMSEGS